MPPARCTLLDWKFPDAYAPVEALPDALDAACEGREGAVYALLTDAWLAELAAKARWTLLDEVGPVR